VLTLPATIGALSKETEVEEFVHAADEYGYFSLTRRSLSLDSLSFSCNIHTKVVFRKYTGHPLLDRLTSTNDACFLL